MSPSHEPASTLPVIDPHRERIRVVDQVTFHPSNGTHLDLTCCALVPRPVCGTEWANEGVVTARLRIDLTMAKAIAKGLLRHVAMIEAAQGTMN